jgi:hypothetical protein
VKTKIILLCILSLLILGCMASMPPTSVTMIGNNKDNYIGLIDHICHRGMPGWCDRFNGTMTMDNGPNGEKFTGKFITIDKTAYGSTRGGAIIPMGNQSLAVASVQSQSSGRFDAVSYWYATGKKGSTMKCELQAGQGGHGQGICKHSNGLEYEMIY